MNGNWRFSAIYRRIVVLAVLSGLVLYFYRTAHQPSDHSGVTLSGCVDTDNLHSLSFIITRFEPFFENQQISEYRSQYIQRHANLTNRYGKENIFGAVLEDGGFGSVMNNALSAYVIAMDADIQRHFQIYFGKWIYPPLNKYFVEFSPTSPFPVFVDIRNNETLLKSLPQFTIAFNQTEKRVQLIGGDHIALRYFIGDGWVQTRNVMADIENRDGTAAVYSLKSQLLRSIWKFKPEYLEILKSFWSQLIDGSGRYFSIHIRRGDKISAKEMSDIPVEDYYSKLVQICDTSNASCSRNVFLMSDDSHAFNQFAALAAPRFKVMNYSHLVVCSGRDVSEFVVDLDGQRPEKFADKMDIHADELILSMTLLAMADQVICTFSSNLCRLAALLKSDPTFKSIHSLDSRWHSL